jgi:CheY-like chemotaxis protein
MQRRALVVDDDPAVCSFIREVIGAEGVEVLALTQSADALAYLHQEKFLVALFDARMPAPDGQELTRQTRESGINQRTPIILISDDQSPAAVARAFSSGASFFMYKPIDKTRLLKLIRATEGAMEHERRRFQRVPLKLRAVIAHDHVELECETIDVSLNGLRACSPAGVPPGTPVRVSLHPSPGVKPIVGLGTVMRRLEGNEIGIELNDLTKADSLRLQDLILPLILTEGRRDPPMRVVHRG